MNPSQPSVAKAATDNSYGLKLLSAGLLVPSIVILLSSLCKYGVGGDVQALKGADIRLALTVWGALTCCVFCIVTTLLGASGSIVEARRNLMSTLVCAAISCSFVLLSNYNAVLHHGGRRQGGAPHDLVAGNSVLLVFWLIFARQAADYVAERTGRTSSAPHLQMRTGESALRQFLPVVIGSCLSGLAISVPRLHVSMLFGLMSVVLNSLGNAIVVYHFFTTWVPVIRAAAPPGTGTLTRLFIEAHPLIIGLLVESLILPMLLTAIFKLEAFQELEQLWLTALLPVRVLALVVCFQTVNTAGDEARQLQLELGAAREGLRVKEQVNQYRAQFLRYVFHEIRNPLNMNSLCISELQDLLKEACSEAVRGVEGSVRAASDSLVLPRAVVLDLVKTMASSSDTMRVIIDDVLDVSKIQGSAFRLRFEPMNLLDEVHSAVKHLRAHAASMNVSLEVRGPQGSALGLGTGVFIADRTRFMQVLVNLVSNACKFSPQDGGGKVIVSVNACRWSTLEDARSGGSPASACGRGGCAVKDVAADEDPWTGTVQIERPTTGECKPRPCAASCDLSCVLSPATGAWESLRGHANTPAVPRQAESQGGTAGQNTSEEPVPAITTTADACAAWPITGRVGMIEIVVSDSGPGIGPVDMSRLFRPFAQLEQGLAYGARGTGLGLAISREIVVRHGGCIGVVSELGNGSDFVVRLPLLECDMSTDSMRAAGIRRSMRGSRVDVASGKLLVRSSSPSEVHPDGSSSSRSVETNSSSVDDTDRPSSATTEMHVPAVTNSLISSDDLMDTAQSADTRSDSTEARSEGSQREPEAGLSVLKENIASRIGSEIVGVPAAAAESSSMHVAPQKMLSLRVLIVEDMATVRKLMARQLRARIERLCREAGVQLVSLIVDEAENGRVAVDEVRAAIASGTPYDIICMDKEMPVMDGYEAARCIRELELAAMGSPAPTESVVEPPHGADGGDTSRGGGQGVVQRAVIIGVTGNAMLQDQADFKAQGLDAVLTKPVDMRDLVNIVLAKVGQSECR